MSARTERVGRVRRRMGEVGIDALLLSLGADLPWLTGYEAMPLERLTMLVLPADDAEPTLVVVTSIAEEHLEGLGDLAGVLREESHAFDGVALAIVPANQPEVAHAAAWDRAD